MSLRRRAPRDKRLQTTCIVFFSMSIEPSRVCKDSQQQQQQKNPQTPFLLFLLSFLLISGRVSFSLCFKIGCLLVLDCINK